jgi:hypothetical protein
VTSSVLRELIGLTAWIDTHEHLVEERHRLRPDGYTFVETFSGRTSFLPSDWTALLVGYPLDDLVCAGMPTARAYEMCRTNLEPLAKWDAVEPYFEQARRTGYLRALDLATERLFGLRLSRDTCEEIDRRCRALRSVGYYTLVLRGVANIERCHVHSLDVDPLCESAQPDLLDADLSLVPLVLGASPIIERMSGIEVVTIDDYLEVIDWTFGRFASKAVAVKCLWAYLRPLDVDRVDSPPRRSFKRLRRGTADTVDQRRVQDFLFLHCLDLATEWHLPVKLHLGYLSGARRAAFPYISRHVDAVARILEAHPTTTFVLMHMAWPHQEQALAVVKHYPNAVIDLCWSWIVAPLAARDFVCRFITTVPAGKLLCFGGDHVTVENVVGHAELARRGLQKALEDLIACDWMSGNDALELAPLLMNGNARKVFPPPTFAASSSKASRRGFS